ncbi:hypothetical protein Tco_1270120, partial [Tanacetum coccineum]
NDPIPELLKPRCYGHGQLRELSDKDRVLKTVKGNRKSFSAHSSSLDGTVATFHFEVKKIGQRLSDVELEKLKKSCYGDIRICFGLVKSYEMRCTVESASLESKFGRSHRCCRRHEIKDLMTFQDQDHLRPYPISKKRVVPAGIELPDWELDSKGECYISKELYGHIEAPSKAT